MLPLRDAAPDPAGDWRHIVRFGRNVASYKFALGRTLLALAAFTDIDTSRVAVDHVVVSDEGKGAHDASGGVQEGVASKVP